jgi:Uma2 family endonuclease
LVIEVISPGSEHRDYEDKREEYFRFGITEYWILDAGRQEMLVLRRSRGRCVERTLRPPQVYRTRLLPGLEFSCALVFQAAAAAGT